MPSAFYIMIKMGWTARRKALNVDQNDASLVPKDRDAFWSTAGGRAARSDEQNVNQGFSLK